MAQLHISIAAETLTTVGPFPITNSLLTTWIVMALLFLFAFFATQNMKRKPQGIQLMAEMLVGGFYNFFATLGGKHGKTFAPLALTIFFFVVTSNWIGLLPGFGTIGFYEGEGESEATRIVSEVKASEAPILEENHDIITLPDEEGNVVREVENEVVSEESHGRKFVPLFRAPTADLNTTIALALIAFFSIQYYGVKFGGGLSYFKKFLNFKGPIDFFVGILETVSDISKIISFAFRLFGNVFAGEVLLAVMAFLFAFFLPIPFYGLEVFVGLIQGLVFAMLVLVFIGVAVSHGDHGEEHAESH